MTKAFGILLTVVALALGSSAAYAGPKEVRDIGEHVSIIQLIANPEKYDGKVVFLSAWATIQFENDTLCMSRQPASSRDCLWLNFDDGPFNSEADANRFWATEKMWKRKYSGKVISVRGTFVMKDTGHLDCCSGAISHITDVYGH